MPFAIIFSIRDEKSQTSVTKVNVPSSTAWADVVEFAEDMASLIDPLITGQIYRVGIAYEVDISALGLTPAAAADSDVEEGARYQMETGTGFFTAMRLPTFDEALILPGSREVDRVNVSALAFENALELGLVLSSTNTVQPCDSRGDDIASVVYARESFQASRSN